MARNLASCALVACRRRRLVVPFANPTSNQTYQCVTVANEDLLDDIAANPGNYYVNLHTQPNFGPGAIRGQLQRG